ncbi:GntR family transcriptional regulator [Thermostaphylospora chromogena]|uniref:DNA-binding transcriptional regulator, GntR family n=1 Tax=Thermostaphylospora chromogena TaxID=35622 RepID=A0A1H1FI91_9ACTN|nr:GntR family transcriptional regulator [Thermostaphylospora chromogena]SDR00554.1 DNA-binding transcriptional regulator, GntR family [Thermostaphylospora chromogena]
MSSSDPVYLRVVDDLRRQIVDGSLAPGAPVPSRAQLTRKYGVGETAARHALRVLAAEGLIYARIGAGHYVRARPALTALNRWPPRDHHASPADLRDRGSRLTYTRRAERVPAGRALADRLHLPESALVVHTRYVFQSDGRPVRLVSSYEPADLADHRLDRPWEGTDGRPARLSAPGLKITRVVESVRARVPEPAESDILDLAAGVCVLHVERTHWAGDRPVETSDTVVSADRFHLLYTLPA